MYVSKLRLFAMVLILVIAAMLSGMVGASMIAHVGPQGPRGYQGPAGPMGPEGPQGVSGNTFDSQCYQTGERDSNGMLICYYGRELR